MCVCVCVIYHITGISNIREAGRVEYIIYYNIPEYTTIYHNILQYTIIYYDMA